MSWSRSEVEDALDAFGPRHACSKWEGSIPQHTASTCNRNLTTTIVLSGDILISSLLTSGRRPMLRMSLSYIPSDQGKKMLD